MSETETQEQFIPTPCVMICTLDENDLCIGCSRTLAEIGLWPDADANLRNQILDNIRARLSSPDID